MAKDLAQAHVWLGLASAQGNEKSGIIRDALLDQMTSKQIAEAERMAGEWKPEAEGFIGTAAASRWEDAEWAEIRDNDAKAALIYRSFAELGNAEAQYSLSNIIEDRPDLVRDDTEAVRWLRRFAEQDYAEAQYKLATKLERGKGVETDHGEAIKWYRMAAEQNHYHAQRGLGMVYFLGFIVPEDLVEAYKWYSLASESRPETSTRLRDGVAEMMTPEQIAEAERLVREWKPVAER